MERDDASLELPVEIMRSMAEAVLDRVLEHLASVGTQPARFRASPDEAATFCRAMRELAPEEGAPLEALLDRYFADWLPRSLTTNGPGYMAYVPGGGVFPAALADLLSNTTNRYTGAWFAAPALVQLEANVLEWFREWMGFPESARGVFTTGGSMAAFNAIVCAREKHLGTRIREGVLYTSTQAHHSVRKSARLAGIAADRIRTVPVDEAFRLSTSALASAIEDDRRAGLTPFLVISSAGTTNTGAVDPLDAIADLCAREGMWHHIDGAYGAFFHACEDLRPLLHGLPRADSLTLDPHKGLFLPYGTGALLVRDGALLRAVHGASADYLPGAAPEDMYDPSSHGPDLSRGFPGLRVWLTVKLFGAARLRAAISEKRDLALEAAERIARLSGVVMVAPPQLSLFAFHLTWPGASREDENAATRALLEDVADRGRVLLSGCTVSGRELARVCVLAFRTRRAHIDACVEDIAAALGRCSRR
jgi:aromatic-L-amino-acid/L-tryptophan decarboxylase